MKRALAIFGILFIAASPVCAASDIQINQLTQSEFRQVSEDAGAAFSYKALTPAEPLGLFGFDIGVEVTATNIHNSDAWDQAFSGSAPDPVYVPKVHLHLGLPLAIDIGAFYGEAPDSNVSLWGGELKWAFIKGSTVMPAIAVRATYSQLSGVDQLDFHTRGLELTISKGIAMFTPYAGLGRVWTTSQPVGIPTLQSEEFDQDKYYVGCNLNLAVINLAIEGDKTGDTSSYGLKLGWRF
jgi:hypothetical protein